MRQTAALALAALVIGCAGQSPEPAADRQGGHPPAGLAAAPMCRLSPEGGPVLADRGIGGTGAPAAKFTPAAAGAAQLAERGIGGTGIVGVITGFASVCVNGLEVTYDDAVPVDLDGTATPLSALRAGQVVVIKANGPAGAPHAQTMSLRQEVSGRIEAVELGSGLLTIAGVPVSVPADTWGANRFGLGDWVAVSGLPRADGVVVASRLDVAPPGVFNVHGRIVQEGTAASIGRLTLPLSMAAGVQDGQPVIVTGVYTEGRKQPVAVNPDTLSADPATYFGPSVNRMVMQAFVRVASGSVWLNGRKVAATPALRGVTGPDGLAVVSLERKPDGSLSATEVRAADLHVHTVATASGSRGAGPGQHRGTRSAACLPAPDTPGWSGRRRAGKLSTAGGRDFCRDHAGHASCIRQCHAFGHAAVEQHAGGNLVFSAGIHCGPTCKCATRHHSAAACRHPHGQPVNSGSAECRCGFLVSASASASANAGANASAHADGRGTGHGTGSAAIGSTGRGAADRKRLCALDQQQRRSHSFPLRREREEWRQYRACFTGQPRRFASGLDKQAQHQPGDNCCGAKPHCRIQHNERPQGVSRAVAIGRARTGPALMLAVAWPASARRPGNIRMKPPTSCSVIKRVERLPDGWHQCPGDLRRSQDRKICTCAFDR